MPSPTSKLWLPPLSSEDQKKLDRLHNDKLTKRIYKRSGFAEKNLWDWLQLLAILAIPVVVALASIFFSLQQNQTNLQIAENQQEENMLQTYLDRMSDLITNNNLLESKPNDDVRQIARARTLTILDQVNSERRTTILLFLNEAKLISGNNVIISLSGANLSGINLTNAANANLPSLGVDLSNADLSGANLSGANLTYCILEGAKLNGADLSNAALDYLNLHNTDLEFAILSGASLRVADLSNSDSYNALFDHADLSYADLRGATLDDADLSYADLTGARITNNQLSKVQSLQDTTMPNGSKHD